MADTLRKREHGWLRFGGGEGSWSVPDPTDETLGQAAWKCRYTKDNLTQTDLFKLAEAFEAYHHLTTHPAGTERTVEQLRAIRRAVKEKP